MQIEGRFVLRPV